VPITFPKERIGLPPRAAAIPTDRSGIEAAKAIMTNPTRYSETLSFKAILVMVSIKKTEDFAKTAAAMIKIRKLSSIRAILSEVKKLMQPARYLLTGYRLRI